MPDLVKFFFATGTVKDVEVETAFGGGGDTVEEGAPRIVCTATMTSRSLDTLTGRERTESRVGSLMEVGGGVFAAFESTSECSLLYRWR